MTQTNPLRDRIREILREWRRGCTCGAAGECAECSIGALEAIEAAINSDEVAL